MLEIEDILNHWPIDKPISIKRVDTGLLNQTYIIRTLDGLFVLQKLHPAVSLDGCTNNYFHMTRFLLKHGKISQSVKSTKTGDLWLEVEGSRWRLISGVEGEVYTTTPNTKIAFEAGKLLALFHTQIKNFDQPLEPTLPMFQYQAVLTKLLNHEQSFINSNNKEVIESFNLLKEEFPKLLLPSNLPQQVIHTDPKISNFLFSAQGDGICMIDFDTIQTLSPLYDIGDCVRSLCGGREDDPNNFFDVKKYQAIIDGYNSVEHLAPDGGLSPAEKNLIPQACQLIMLGLASRFLNDYIDDNYFGWDEAKYQTRQQHNLARCLGQIALWNSTKQHLNQI